MQFFLILLSLALLSQSMDPQAPSAGRISVGSSSFCPAYVCQTSSVKTGCATYSGSQMLLEGCLGDWYCDWSTSASNDNQYQFGKCVMRRLHAKFRKHINEFCYQNSDCKSNYCVLNKCSVKSSGATCSNTLECGKGLYCNSDSDTCQPWITDGSDCKGKYYGCKPNSACTSMDGGSTYTCTALFSVSTNTISYVYSAYQSISYDYLCSSGDRTSTGACSSSTFTLSGGYPKTCTSSLDCAASGDANRYESCYCWPNTEGVGYCMPFSGDIPSTMSRMKSKMTRDFSNCYNYEIAYAINGCDSFNGNDDNDWAPQKKKGTWGYCYDSVGLKVTTSVSTYINACPPLKCNTGNNNEGYCFQYAESSHMFYVQSCPSNYICGSYYTGRYNLYRNHVPCVYGRHRDRKAHKGEYCWVDGDCYSGNCDITKVCIAKSLGSTCENVYECDKGLKCKYSSSSIQSTCQKWIEVGGQCTNENYGLCREGLFCKATGAGVTSGTCQPFYSIAGGSSVYVMTSSSSYQSDLGRYCISGAYDKSSNTCQSTSDKLDTFPKQCAYDNSNTDCRSTNYKDTNIVYSSCTCYPNTAGQHYCQPFTANIDPDYFTWAKTYYAQDLSNCYAYEIGNNLGGSCGMGERYLDIWGRSVPSQYFPNCGKNVLYDESRYEDRYEDDLIYLWASDEDLFLYENSAKKLFFNAILSSGILLFSIFK